MRRFSTSRLIHQVMRPVTLVCAFSRILGSGRGQRYMRKAVITAVTVGTFACATTGGVRTSQGSGETRFYRTTFDTLWDASLLALAENGLEIVDIARDSGYVLASGAGSFWSYGERVGVFVGRDSSNTQALAVEVVSKRVLATNITAKNWKKPIFAMLEAHLPSSAMVEATAEPGAVPRLTLSDLRECQQEVESGDVTLHVTEDQLSRCRQLQNRDAVEACLVEASEKTEEPIKLEELNRCLARRKDSER